MCATRAQSASALRPCENQFANCRIMCQNAFGVRRSRNYHGIINDTTMVCLNWECCSERFISRRMTVAEKHLVAQSRCAVRSEINIITSQSKNNIRLPLFIRKSDVEGKSFYYIGELTINSAKEVKTALGSPIVKFQFTIDKPVEESLYRYITKN